MLSPSDKVLEKLKKIKLTQVSKLTSESSLYLKATALKGHLIQMKERVILSVVLGKRLSEERVIRNHIKYSPHTIPTIISTQIGKKEPRIKDGGRG